MAKDINTLIAEPQLLLQREAFKRSIARSTVSAYYDKEVSGNTTSEATLPKLRWKRVTQERYLQELHPESHDVLVDANIPYISVRLEDGNYQEVKHKRLAMPYQRTIRNKALLHLCGNNTEHTLLSTEPTEKEELDFTTFKQYWYMRNQDGKRFQAVKEQMGTGMAGWLYYFDRYGEIQSKILPFSEGYILCPHFDDNGDTLMNAVYYEDSEERERIDAYDDTHMYTWIKSEDTDVNNIDGWTLINSAPHGFTRCPLIIQKGQVAWDDAQTLIEAYEIIYNIFTVIMKRHGWGILYIKGNISQKVEKLAGSVIIKDTSYDGTGDAQFKTPPNPDGMFDMLQSLEERIQIAASTTFLLPKDISMSGDISGIAIQLTQSGDNEKAANNAIEWQDAINMATYLFKEGLAKELVNKGENPTAVTDFAKMQIGAKFVPWMPKSLTEMAQVLSVLIASNITSKETGAELMTSWGVNKPSEKQRLKKEQDEAQTLLEKTQENADSSTVTTEEIDVVNDDKAD